MRELFVLLAHLCKTLVKLCRLGGLYAVAAESLAPKFDYKLAWFERLLQHAKRLFASDKPVVVLPENPYVAEKLPDLVR